MADSSRLMATITKRPGVSYPVLVPNITGYHAAVSILAESGQLIYDCSERHHNDILLLAVPLRGLLLF